MKIDVNDKAVRGIAEYCKGRNYRCSSCRFSIWKYSEKDKCKWATCIFSDCPCDWEWRMDHENAVRVFKAGN